jgi:hypothetical protein
MRSRHRINATSKGHPFGVDFHARVQTVAYCNSEGGEIHLQEFEHFKDDIHAFYSQFPVRKVVGLEASGYSDWFERLLEEVGCEVWLGQATNIRLCARRRQKNDHRDAELTDFTQGVGRRIECWCYGQHQPLTNPRSGSLLDCADLSQYTLQVFVIGSHLSISLARWLEPPASFELPLVQTAVGTLRFSNDSRSWLSRAR